MIFLSHVESFGELNLCGNRIAKFLWHFFDKITSFFELLFIHAPYSAPVLSAVIWTLPVNLGRVMHHKEAFQKLFVRDLFGIIDNADSLCVTCCSLTYVSVCGVLGFSLLIPRICCEDPWGQLEGMLYSPEATASKICHRVVIWDLMVCGDTCREGDSLLTRILYGCYSVRMVCWSFLNSAGKISHG